MKILFLDDDETRHDIYRKWSIGHDVTHVRTAEEAIKAINATDFDYLSLDHDLGGEMYVSEVKGHGQEVAKAVALMDKARFPRYGVVVHSYNVVGARRMVEIIEAAFGPMAAFHVPFGPTHETMFMHAERRP